MARRNQQIDDLQPLDRPTRVDGRIEHTIIDFTNADVHGHLQYLFNHTRGYVFLATLDRSEVKPIPRDTSFRWPEDYDKMIEWISEAIQKPWTEVFICPYPMKQRVIMEGDRKRSGRKAGASSSRWVIHADVDRPLTRTVSDRLRAWGFRVVASGTPGHVQVYARLSRSLTVAEHRGLAEALRAFVNGDDKISDNDYLKLPGSWNHKNHPRVEEHKRNDRKYPVSIISNGRPKVDADRLIKELKATPLEAETAVEPTPQWQVVPGAWKYKLPGHLQTYMHMSADEASDRSQACMAAVLAFAEHGLTRDQVHTALDDFDPGVDKYKTSDRWHNEIDRILGKQRAVAPVGEGFWDRTTELNHIYTTAMANLAGPWATLGVVLANALMAVGPDIQIPAVGGELGSGIRSLNFFVLLAGGSAQGKGTATQAGFHAIRFGNIPRAANVGSGQGVARVFKRPARKGEEGSVVDGMVWERKSAYLDIPEVGVLASIIGNKDTTLGPELCKAWAGELLGTQTNTTERNVTVERDSYRLCAIVGGQPTACGPLLDKSGIGLPQRFLFMPTDGEEDQIPEDPIPVPEPIVVDLPKPNTDNGPYVVKLPVEIRREIWEYRRDVRKKRIKVHEMDKHALLLRLKTAVALALVHGRMDVDHRDWEMAGVVLGKSAATVRAIQADLRAVDVRADRTAGQRQAARDISRMDAMDRARYDRVSVRVLKVLEKLHASGKEWSGGLGSKMPSVKTEDLNAVLSQMTAKKIIDRRTNATGGHQYRIRPSQ
jgi:hypothetical protein